MHITEDESDINLSLHFSNLLAFRGINIFDCKRAHSRHVLLHFIKGLGLEESLVMTRIGMQFLWKLILAEKNKTSFYLIDLYPASAKPDVIDHSLIFD